MITTAISILVLTMMEIVLGIDNIIFLGILSKTIQNKQSAELARKIGLSIALGIRIIALISLAHLIDMTDPVWYFTKTTGIEHPVSVRDAILFSGGLFLIYKSTREIHGLFEKKPAKPQSRGTMFKIITQIVLIDLAFSVDSILTAIGLVDKLEIMITAVTLSMTLMYFLSKKISDFIDARPSFKVLALAFLIMIGAIMVIEGTGMRIDKTYIYFAMGFAGVIEAFNSTFKIRKKGKSQTTDTINTSKENSKKVSTDI